MSVLRTEEICCSILYKDTLQSAICVEPTDILARDTRRTQRFRHGLMIKPFDALII